METDMLTNAKIALSFALFGVRRNGRFHARGPSSLGDGALGGGVANACDILPEL
jgi:hypothetical protein